MRNFFRHIFSRSCERRQHRLDFRLEVHAEQIAALNKQLVDFVNAFEPRLKELEGLLIDKQIPYTLPPNNT